MDKPKRVRVTVPSWKTNPFEMSGFFDKTRNLQRQEELAVLSDTGEAITIRRLKEGSVLADPLTFTKVFHQGIDLIMEADFTLPEYKLWLYMIRNIKPNKDQIEIDQEHCIKVCHWKKVGTFKSTVRKLIAKGLICKSTAGNHTYWINPNYCYNGDRRIHYNKKSNIQPAGSFTTNA